MAYRLSRKAEDDILAIYLAGARLFGAAQADRYHAGLERTFAFLADNPHAARERSELRLRSRAFPYGTHLIFYRLDGSDIFIQRIRDMREDWTD